MRARRAVNEARLVLRLRRAVIRWRSARAREAFARVQRRVALRELDRAEAALRRLSRRG